MPAHTYRFTDTHSREAMDLMRRLRRHSPVRQAAEALLEGREVESIAPLLEALARTSDSRWKERTVAAWALGWLPLTSEETHSVAVTLGRVLENRKVGVGTRCVARIARATIRTGIIGLMCAGCIFLIGMRSDSPFTPAWAMVFMIFCLSAMILFVACVFAPCYSILYDIDCTNRVRVMAANTLGRLGQHQSAEVLADAALDSSRTVAVSALVVLRSLLPLLGPEHYGQLSGQTVPKLCRLLGHPGEIVVREVLEALDKVGDGRAVRAVQRLAGTHASEAVRQTASRIVPILQERQRQEAAQATLLRASAATEMGTRSLLRPTSAGMQEPETLLRADVASHGL